ncbi:MAG: hypothetical protein IPK66_15465 [Rhodospirillales bacterium]|nr:hypothetical protein [Rhodospirillales bacterium]
MSELCVLAGFADRAARFITAETSVELVREALLEARPDLPPGKWTPGYAA